MVKREKYQTFLNPSGFIEQHFIGVQTPDSVIGAVDELVKQAKKRKAKKRPVLILICVEQVPKIDISGKMAPARKQAVKAMVNTEYDRIAIYGNVAVQIMVSTLVLIAGKRSKIKVFNDRQNAVGWLKGA